MTRAEIIKLLTKRITYKPGWKIIVFAEHGGRGRVCYTIIYRTQDVKLAGVPDATVDIRRDGEVRTDITERELVARVHTEIRHMERHECDEWLMVDGEPVVNPHKEAL